MIKIVPEMTVQKYAGKLINDVDARSRSVKTTIDTINETVIIIGLRRSFDSLALLPTIIGSTGITHGARIVKIPAKNEAKANWSSMPTWSPYLK